jgi:hypothetical protein
MVGGLGVRPHSSQSRGLLPPVASLPMGARWKGARALRAEHGLIRLSLTVTSIIIIIIITIIITR